MLISVDWQSGKKQFFYIQMASDLKTVVKFTTVLYSCQTSYTFRNMAYSVLSQSDRIAESWLICDDSEN